MRKVAFICVNLNKTETSPNFVNETVLYFKPRITKCIPDILQSRKEFLKNAKLRSRKTDQFLAEDLHSEHFENRRSKFRDRISVRDQNIRSRRMSRKQK